MVSINYGILTDNVLTVDDLMRILLITRNKAYDLLRSGEIHGFKCGNIWRIQPDEVTRYLNCQKKQVKKQI